MSSVFKKFIAIGLSAALSLGGNAVCVLADSEVMDNVAVFADSKIENNVEVLADSTIEISEEDFVSDVETEHIEEEETIGIGAKSRSKEDIAQYIDKHPCPLNIAAVDYVEKPSYTGVLNPGKLKDSFNLNGLNMLNVVRYIAGLDEVTDDESFNKGAQASAFINAMFSLEADENIGIMSHRPDKAKGLSDELYQLGYDASMESNLAWISYNGESLANAIVRLMADSDPGNISTVGHRRWFINPHLGKVGFGIADGSKLGTFTAIHCHDESHDDSSDGIAWPAQKMPLEIFNNQMAWSYTTNERIDKSTVKVVLKRRSDGATWNFPDSNKSYDESNFWSYYFNVDSSVYYGSRSAIIFRPDKTGGFHDGDIFDVDITYGDNKKVKYSVEFFKPFGSKVEYTLGSRNGVKAVNHPDNPTRIFKDSPAIKLKDPTLDGYIFLGWTMSGEPDKYITEIPANVVDDIKLVANWAWGGVLNGKVNWRMYETKFTVEFTGEGPLKLPEGTKDVPWLSRSNSIQKFIIGDDITDIDINALYNTQYVKEFVISDNHKYITYKDGIFYNKDMTKLLAVTKQYMILTNSQEIDIPKTITEISDSAFDVMPYVRINAYSKMAVEYAKNHNLYYNDYSGKKDANDPKDTQEKPGNPSTSEDPFEPSPVVVTDTKVFTPSIRALDNGIPVPFNEITEDSVIYLDTKTEGASLFFTIDGSDPIVIEKSESDTKTDNTNIVDKDINLDDFFKDFFKDLFEEASINNDGGVENINEAENKSEEASTTYLYSNGIVVKDVFKKINNTASEDGTKNFAITSFKLKVMAKKAGLEDSKVSGADFICADDNGFGDILLEDRKQFTSPLDVKKGLWVAGIEDLVYTGKALTFNDLRVYMNNKLLKPSKEYTVKYKNNINAGVASVIITGKGNFKGSINKTFKIKPLNLSDDGVKAGDVALSYNGKLQKGIPDVFLSLKDGAEVPLKAGKDYLLEYPGTVKNQSDYNSKAFVEKGTYTINIKSKDNKNVLGGIKVKQYISENAVPVVNKAINKCEISYSPSVVYTGEAVETPVTVKDKDTGKVLTKGVDYSICYSNNMAASNKAVIEISGKGIYRGTVKKSFKILKKDISKENIQVESTAVFTKGGAKPKVSITAKISGNDVQLDEGVDYIVSFKNNKSAVVQKGSPSVKITGKGNYTGVVEKSFSIEKGSLENVIIYANDKEDRCAWGDYKVPISLYDSDGKKLEAGKDYDKNIVYTYENDCTIFVFSDMKAVPFKRAKGSLVKDTDKVRAPVKIRATVKGLDNGNYTGETYVVYAMTDPENMKPDIAKASVKIDKQEYAGKSVRPAKEAFNFTLNGSTVSASDFEIIQYSNNLKVGKGTALIKGTGKLSGIKAVSYTIVPKLFK